MILPPAVVPCPLCSLWAADWWEWVHSPSWRDREVGRGCLCTQGQPSLPCPGSVCWEYVPSVCSLSTVSQTVAQGPWRALAPGPFPGKRKLTQTKGQLHINRFIFTMIKLVTLQRGDAAGTYRQPKTGHFHRLFICVPLFGIVDQLEKIKHANINGQ